MAPAEPLLDPVTLGWFVSLGANGESQCFCLGFFLRGGMWKGPYRKSCGCIEAVVDRLFFSGSSMYFAWCYPDDINLVKLIYIATW